MKADLFTHLTLPLLAMTWGPVAAPIQRSNASLTPDRILEAIQVQEGNTVCEIGAGDGEISIAAARMVGAKGRVFSSELGESRISKLREKTSGIAQITVVAGEHTKTNFPDGRCDGIFMRDVYHHFTDPAAMNRSIAAALKPGGRVAVVDFTPPGKEAGRAAERAQDGQHGVSAETVTAEMKQAGFEPVSSELPGQRWFMVVLAKADNSR